jgi:hypothetical protein
MRARGLESQISDSAGDHILFPEAVDAVFPIGYEIYSSEGKLIASVPGPAKVVLRGKAGEAKVEHPTLMLDHLPSLSAKQAAALVIPSSYGRARPLLSLNGLSTLPDSVAVVLAQAANKPRYGNPDEAISLEVNGVSDMSPSSASALASIAGKNAEYSGATLSLNGLQHLSPEVAKALSRYRGGALRINGVTSLSAEAAGALAALEVDRLELNGLKNLPAEIASALSKLKTRAGPLGTVGKICLDGLKYLSEESAAQLGRFSGSLELNSLELLGPDLAAAFVSSVSTRPGAQRPQRVLSFAALTDISEAAAEGLARYGATALFLGGIKKLDAKTLAAFQRHGVEVSFNYSSGVKDVLLANAIKTDAAATLFLTEEGYNKLKEGEEPEWIGLPEGLYDYPVSSAPPPHENAWASVDDTLLLLDGFEGDPWQQVDDYAGRGVVMDIVYAHHPLTYKAYANAAKNYSSSGGKPKWSIPHTIAGASETLEWASGSAIGIRNALFDSLASISNQERSWLIATLPGIYQAVVDVYRQDLSTLVSDFTDSHIAAQALPQKGAYLEFYRAPFVLSK